MPQPKIADKCPLKVTVEAGTHAWCACGESKSQPFCDGAHRGGSFVPLRFSTEGTKEVFLCQCKATKNPPYCDGSHKTL